MVEESTRESEKEHQARARSTKAVSIRESDRDLQARASSSVRSYSGKRRSDRTRKSRKSMGFNQYKLQACKSQDALKHVTSDPDSKNIKKGLQLLAIQCLHNPAFEYVMGIVIISNIVVMIIEIDGAADEEDMTGDTTQWTEVFGYVVLLIFVVELLLRLFAFRRLFWMDAWNIFDFIVVFTDITVFFIGILFGNEFSITILRMFRLAKLARVSKVLRVFPELRLLLASLLSSISAIFWGAVLLGLVLLAWAMAAVLFIHPLNKQMEYEKCDRCRRAYSSVMQSLLTFWQSTVIGDNWGEATIPLIERHPSTAIFFIPLFLSVGMAVVSLILGMVVSVAQRAEAAIKEVDNAQETAAKFERQSNLLKQCKQMDIDHSGNVCQDELLAAFENPGEFRDSMEVLGITREDFDVVWAILDTNGVGQVSYKRLVSRLYSMKTSDSQFTLAYLKYHVTLIGDILKKMEDFSAAEGNKIEVELQKVEKKEELLLERQEQVLEQLQKAVSNAERKKDEDRGNNGLAMAMPQARKGNELQTQEAEKGTSLGLVSLKDCTSTGLSSSQGGTSANNVDETHFLLKKVCRDIDLLRCDLKDMLTNVDRKLSARAPTLSVLERDVMRTEKQLDLLVVPEKAASCNLLPRCNALNGLL